MVSCCILRNVIAIKFLMNLVRNIRSLTYNKRSSSKQLMIQEKRSNGRKTANPFVKLRIKCAEYSVMQDR